MLKVVEMLEEEVGKDVPQCIVDCLLNTQRQTDKQKDIFIIISSCPPNDVKATVKTTE